MTTPPKELHYIVVERFGEHGRSYSCTSLKSATREAVIQDILEGVYPDPVRVVAFNPVSSDVSPAIAKEVLARAHGEKAPMSDPALNFCERYGFTPA